MLTDTILQPTLKKKKSVSKLEVKDTKKASKYMVTTQDVGSDGEFQTRYYKVSFDYTPDIRSMWGYIVFAFPFVRLFVPTYVHSYIRSSFHHRVKLCVKVYKTSYFEDPLMDFIHIWHDGRYRFKVFISIIPTPGVTLGLRSRT